MSFATKCICGKSISGYCRSSIKDCRMIVRNIEEEKNTKDNFYLVPKELMDKLMYELGSFAYVTQSFEELNPINEALTSCKLIDLSDEAIDKLKWEFVAKTKNDLTWSEGKSYSQALEDLKQTKC